MRALLYDHSNTLTFLSTDQEHVCKLLLNLYCTLVIWLCALCVPWFWRRHSSVDYLFRTPMCNHLSGIRPLSVGVGVSTPITPTTNKPRSLSIQNYRSKRDLNLGCGSSGTRCRVHYSLDYGTHSRTPIVTK